MKILALDSSAVSASCAVLEDDRLIAEFFVNAGLTHSQTLMPMVESTLKNAAVDMADIDLFAVSQGPGSFTGIRIGVAAVKGMAQALDKPCVGISTLEAVAYQFTGLECVVCAAMDARRQQVYNALFRVEGDQVERICEDRAVSLAELEQDIVYYDEGVTLAGDGARLCYQTFSPDKADFRLALPALLYQRSYGVGLAAFHKNNSDYQTAEQLNPVYLRLPQAERELKLRRETGGN
ncbi:MAG: tRNA (adenosine(37)-N6)-threonylcarbamoyltransferase complex dimerization subunit type 1 TsaB [Clostridiales bacterium]|nr:tRNA (adenosine(37)-N6)-threonylcarbamoyltransferase complex dimerization subunit type 1 TsaB [Clostridiales bacterium]